MQAPWSNHDRLIEARQHRRASEQSVRKRRDSLSQTHMMSLYEIMMVGVVISSPSIIPIRRKQFQEQLHLQSEDK